jgi:hypothetical protein
MSVTVVFDAPPPVVVLVLVLVLVLVPCDAMSELLPGPPWPSGATQSPPSFTIPAGQSPLGAFDALSAGLSLPPQPATINIRITARFGIMRLPLVLGSYHSSIL